MDREVFICSCGSMEHQMTFWYDDEANMFYTEVHLTTRHNIFKRFWYSLKYTFGYKCRFGAWDEFIFDPESELKLLEYLKNKHEVNNIKNK
jgi:hypothetical protein